MRKTAKPLISASALRLLVALSLLVAFGCVRQRASSPTQLLVHNGRDPAQAAADPEVRDNAWVVRILVDRDGPHLCSGSLIADDIVLTAAHCIYRVSGKPLHGMIALENIKVETGVGTSALTTYAVTAASMHPRLGLHDRLNATEDLALLRLARKVPPSAVAGFPQVALTPADLGRAGIPGRAFTFFGYGLINDTDPAAKLLYGKGLALSYAECLLTVYGPVRAGTAGKKYDEYLCTAVNPLSMQAAGGDSGGPAVANVKGRQTIVGVVSSRFTACATGKTLNIFWTLQHPATKGWINAFKRAGAGCCVVQ